MDIVISSGHGLKVRGAKGYLDEVDEARNVVNRVATLVRGANVGADVFHDDNSSSVSANLNAIVNYHNGRKRDRDVSVHFNAYQTTSKAMGCEVLYVSQQNLAAQVAAAVANAGGFINRGAKKRTDLAFLNRTAQPAILIEVCFVDSASDTKRYRDNFEAICAAIAESIAGIKLPGTPPPVEPPVPPPPQPEWPTGDNVVDIVITVTGEAQVTLNGDPIGDAANVDVANRVALTLAHEGDIIVTINGEDFQIAPPPLTPRPTLRVGSRGRDVRVVQEVLNVAVDGIFGRQTEDAVKTFQSGQGLTADGVVGPRTWAALERVFDLPDFEPTEWFEDVTCTIFGGAADPNDSAYAPFGPIDDTVIGVALPYRFSGARPKVALVNHETGREVIAEILDVGPWLIDDNYWDAGTRPLAETCFKQDVPLPRGPHQGKKSNGAGIDVTPGAARALGLAGKGKVDWKFV